MSMRSGINRTIEDRLEDIETEVRQIKLMLTELLGSRAKPLIATEEGLMNVKDVARFLKVDATVVYAACNKGELPFVKVGKMYKFRKPDVLKWLDTPTNNKETNIDAYISRYLQKHTLKG
jgi:excisionase family DNA binding protein